MLIKRCKSDDEDDRSSLTYSLSLFIASNQNKKSINNETNETTSNNNEK